MNQDFTPTPPEALPATPITDEQVPAPQQGNKKTLMGIGVALVVLVLSTAVWAVLHKSSDSTNDSNAISASVASISIGNSGYAPQAITVKEGQPVMFTNTAGSTRQLTADATLLPGFSTVEPLDQGDSYTYVFEQKGTFHYYDSTDPANFVGTITVD